MTRRIPTTVWHITPAVVLALDEHLGAPMDSFVNGSQTWLEDHGPNGVTLEWRLHPAPGYRPPPGLSHYELWEAVTGALLAHADPAELTLGVDARALESVWEGLECFPAHEDEATAAEPAELRGRVAGILGIEPDAFGLVDHEAISSAWEEASGKVSIVQLVLDQLTT